MKKLLKQHGFFSDMQYFQSIVDAYKIDCKEKYEQMFKALPKGEKRNFILSLQTFWNSGLSENDIHKFIKLIND